MSNHPERQDWNEGRIIMTINDDDYTAYCSPNAEGDVYVEAEQINDATMDTGDAPFPFDIVFHGHYPSEGEVESLERALPEKFGEEFDDRVDSVYEMIEESDSPLDAIQEMEPDDLLVDEE